VAGPAASTPVENASTKVGTSADHTEEADTDEETSNGAVGRKRRGIRLKQDLG
jgi:hypothetical protein